MSGYRWLDAEGRPISPLHRSPVTAARWLGRYSMRQRTRPSPRLLVQELAIGVKRRPRRRPLDGRERAVMLGNLTRMPFSARPWLLRQGKRDQDRRRRRAGTRAMTAQLRAGIR